MIILKLWQRLKFRQKFLKTLEEVIESVYSETQSVSGTRAKPSITWENSESLEDTL